MGCFGLREVSPAKIIKSYRAFGELDDWSLPSIVNIVAIVSGNKYLPSNNSINNDSKRWVRHYMATAKDHL